MHKELEIASNLFALASGVCLSLGMLTPSAVRSAGERLAAYLQRRPKGGFLARAYETALPQEDKTGLLSFLGLLSSCFVEAAVELITFLVACALVLASLLALSIWSASAFADAYPIARWSPLIATVWVCLALACDEAGIGAEMARSTGLAMVAGRTLRAICATWRIVEPLLWVAHQLVSIFTKGLPLLWYRALKAIHSRGLEWVFNLAGFLLFVSSVALQISSVVVSP